MARAILLVAGILWLLAAVAGIGLALAGVDELLRFLPPLAIAADAVSRTLAALAVGAALLALAHLVIAGGVRRDRRWAISAGVLLTAGAAVGFVALSAAAVTSGAAGSLDVPAAVAAALTALLAALGYGAAAASLIHRLRSGEPV